MNLTKIRNLRPIIAIIILVALFGFALLIVFNLKKARVVTPKDFLPATEQPLTDGKFDEAATVSQDSKAQLAKIKDKLPYRKSILSSTGDQITVSTHHQGDEFTLYVEMFPIEFQSSYEDPNLPRNVLNFREGATFLYNWLKENDVDPSKIFISWGSKAYTQETARQWLNETPQFPKIIKRDNQFVFETEPVKNQ